jgi:hypothetical protein
MKVRLLVALAGSSGALSGQPGDVREGPDELCRKFIDAGLVEAVADEPEADEAKAKRK